MDSPSKNSTEQNPTGQENKNKLYPIFLKLEQLNTLLVGAGNVGLEKLHSLLSNSPEAKIMIVAPDVKEEVKRLVREHPSCNIIQKKFEDSDLENKGIVICATDNKELHKRIKLLANQRGLLVNVADTPDLCDFYLGSIVQKGNLKIAISTNGKSPTVAKRLKEVISDIMPDELEEVLNNMQVIRNAMTGSFEEKVKRLNEITKELAANTINNDRHE
jgi:siroheme synthase-like protein